MRIRIFISALLLAASAVCFSKANGAWLEKVPESDRQRQNPYAGQEDAISAGRNLFVANCAHCHGANAEGKGSRPGLRSDRIRGASDGDLAWLLKNGDVFKGMPRWAGLPEQQRWQIVAYLRSLNTEAGRDGR